MRPGVLLVTSLVAALLAGCLAGPAPSSAGSEIPIARQPGLDDPWDVRVHVFDPTGETDRPIEGARVVFFTNAASGPATPIYNTNLDGKCWKLTLGEDPLVVLAEGRTGPLGRVRGLVDPDAHPKAPADGDPVPLGVAVDAGEGYTREAYVGQVPGSSPPCGMRPIDLVRRTLSDVSRSVSAPVYPTTLPFTVHGNVTATVAGPKSPTVQLQPVWQPHAVAGDQCTKAQVIRLAGIAAELSWTNGADGWADLHLGFGAARSDRPEIVGEDRRQGPLPGTHAERIDAGIDETRLFPPCAYGVGPIADEPVVTPGAIGYRIAGNLTFEGTDVAFPDG